MTATAVAAVEAPQRCWLNHLPVISGPSQKQHRPENPLVYMCEGFRAALTTVPHMSLWVIYPVLVAFSVLFTWLGIRNFKRRVLS